MPCSLRNKHVIPTIDDLDKYFGIKGSKILLRIDINSPIDPKTGDILDDSRIRAHSATVRELVERGAAVVVMSHQGRPGDSDFVSLDKHARLLEKHTGLQVRFIDDVIGPAAREAIKSLQPGDILLLDNTRLVSEEIIEATPEKHAESIFVTRLAPLFNYYVNDAFATAHRSQPSIVGFPVKLPSAAGRVMEKELTALSKLYNPEERPRVFVLGGGKVHDTIRILEHLHNNGAVDRILATGLVAELFMVAKGINIGEANLRVLEAKGLLSLLPRARRLLLRGLPLETPVDFRTLVDDHVEVETIGNIKGVIKDIGPQTVKMYTEIMKEARLIVMRGPAGVIEDPRFREGSRELVRAAVESNAYVIVGGGHLNSIIAELGLAGRPNLHVSTGGGALLLFLAGEDLPGLTALAKSAEKFFPQLIG
ncbi:Phosphoglycerate kinase [Pyrodictium delaneyi]|uniref:Phosphoglycerate kinase n=1 Tax=Pyrodictium delaneyi TaxID=1273541 RepID=A0A0P0N5C7_9CREN|nr:phosphoglycerate kinase [Pyrodictium delaneyi]ALL01717.1 Phosphoglycerate kinase [Pyrodictium delaneyi]OWJ55056.1 phosphoglycerate kinase [Pyrodictium delaneyi]